MQKATRKTGLISVSGKCFSLALIFFLMFAPSAEALTVSGIPDWLNEPVTRSLKAVWSEIPNLPDIDREGTLIVVASRLFTGYEVLTISSDADGEPAIFFAPEAEQISPVVEIVLPDLRGIALEWFKEDVSGLREDISALVAGLPQDALTWADEALREKISESVKYMLPGWEFSQQIIISQNRTAIHISFRPRPPMILAVNPVMPSRTIPAVFRNDLEARLIPELSPLIGVPVKWAETHSTQIENYAREFLSDRNAIQNMRANIDIKFSPGTISDLTARVDSETLDFNLWVSAYAGISGRFPEIGTSFSYKSLTQFHPEIYAELIFWLDNFSENHRLGWRFEPYENFWMGVEMQWPDDKYFLRFLYRPLFAKNIYFWWRWSPELKAQEGAAGWNMDEHLTLEIYYDNTEEDKLGLRGIWHL